MTDLEPTLRFFSPNLKFLIFSSGTALWCRKDLARITQDDAKEATEIIDLFMEDEHGNA